MLINPHSDLYAFELDILNQTEQTLKGPFEEFKVLIREAGQGWPSHVERDTGERSRDERK